MRKQYTKQKISKLPKAVEDCHQLIKWMISHIDKFPRARKFTLGDRIESKLLQILEDLVAASYLKDKRSLLQRANLNLEVTRHLWRLAFELKSIAVKSFEYGARLMFELGRQIGGWLKAA